MRPCVPGYTPSRTTFCCAAKFNGDPEEHICDVHSWTELRGKSTVNTLTCPIMTVARRSDCPWTQLCMNTSTGHLEAFHSALLKYTPKRYKQIFCKRSKQWVGKVCPLLQGEACSPNPTSLLTSPQR